MKYWFSTVNHGLKTYSKAFIWEGGGMVHLSWTLACLATGPSPAWQNWSQIIIFARSQQGCLRQLWKGGLLVTLFPLIVRTKILESFCFLICHKRLDVCLILKPLPTLWGICWCGIKYFVMLQIFPALWSIFIRWGGEAGGQFSASLADYCRSVWLWHKHVGMVERATSGQCLLHMTYGDCINSGQQGKLNTSHFEKKFTFLFCCL